MARAQNFCVIAAGGTGGHMFPAQALAEALVAKGWRVRLSTDDRGARYAAGFPEAVERRQVLSATPARGGALAKLLTPFLLAAGVVQAVFQLALDRPSAVVGFGGYPTIPALIGAGLLRIPRMIHEQNGVLGRVNRFFARRVSAVACGAWPTALPSGVLGHHTGNPVRAAILDRSGAAYIPPGDYPMSIVVVGGSQGARVLSDVVPEAIRQLPPELLRNVRVAHQARGEDEDRVRAFYDAHDIKAEVQPFFDDIPRRFSEAQLVVARSGASTIADLSVVGRPSILVPYVHATGDHQTANARQLVEAEAAIMMPEARFNAETLAAEITRILTNPAAAETMAANALATGRPDATERLVDMVERLTGGRS